MLPELSPAPRTLLMMLAGAYARLGKPIDGLNCLAEAAQIIETTDERIQRG